MIKKLTGILFCKAYSVFFWVSKKVGFKINDGNMVHQLATELKNMGDKCLKSGDFTQAIIFYEKSLEIDSLQPRVYNNLGVANFYQTNTLVALERYYSAVSIDPVFADAYNNIGLALNDCARLDEALENYDRAICLEANNADAYYNKGNTLVKLKRLDDALVCYERAIIINPNFANAYNNCGALLSSLNRYDEALKSIDHAIGLDPDNASAYNNRGHVLDSMGRLNEALNSYNTAIALNHDYGMAYINRAVVLDSLNRFDEALMSYGHALALMPDHEFLFGQWLDAKMQICDWTDYDNQIALLAEKIRRGEEASTPFLVLSKLESRELQKKAAETYTRKKCPGDISLTKMTQNLGRKKLRIGYFSADFRNHPVSYLTAEMFELHDRSKFDLVGFAFGSSKNDEMTLRISMAFEEFIDVRDKSDLEIVCLARALEIDIAVDLGGFTTDSRTGIFAQRAAPLQISYLGYLGTMGADYIDYLIADLMIIPPHHQKDYTEKIIYLPSYQVNDTKRTISNRLFLREEMGLPISGFVFCCFNNNYKITPRVFDIWMRILNQVKNSVLWLFGGNERAVANLKGEAMRRGVDAERLIFAPKLPLPEYLARYRLADLFLDTSPYNAGATASDALWAGVPVLTCLGETFSSRVAASLLRALGLPELITATQDEYEKLAIAIANHPEKLQAIKHKLFANRLEKPLFDTENSCRAIEAAYTKIYDRYRSGMRPDHVYIQ